MLTRRRRFGSISGLESASAGNPPSQLATMVLVNPDWVLGFASPALPLHPYAGRICELSVRPLKYGPSALLCRLTTVGTKLKLPCVVSVFAPLVSLSSQVVTPT